MPRGEKPTQVFSRKKNARQISACKEKTRKEKRDRSSHPQTIPSRTDSKAESKGGNLKKTKTSIKRTPDFPCKQVIPHHYQVNQIGTAGPFIEPGLEPMGSTEPEDRSKHAARAHRGRG
jgi:hypothetical protein